MATGEAIEEARALLAEREARLAEREEELAKLREENKQLRHNVEAYRRMAFGPSSEKRKGTALIEREWRPGKLSRGHESAGR